MSVNKGMNKEDMAHIYSGISLSHEKNETVPFAAMCMDLEILTEVRERQIFIWNHLRGISLKKYRWTSLQNRNRLTDTEQTYDYPKGNVREGGIN